MTETLQDHKTMVHAADVERYGLGGVLLARIRFRCNVASGGWSASLATVAEETGLTVKQVRTATAKLVAAGEIELSKPNAYRGDQTLNYRTCPPGQIGAQKGKSPFALTGKSFPLSKELLKNAREPVQVELFNETDQARADRRSRDMSASYEKLRAIRNQKRAN